ncbi:MAG: hypothetical protein IAE79_02685 [Anaerolinea sp.]|nr:hypothetical protein [Anaerolinea sp.]
MHLYRLGVALVIFAALALTILIPHDQRRLHMPEPWSYALAAQNFAQGKWTLSNDEIAAARTEVRLQGSRLTQYVEIEPDRWAFRQSPGHPLQMAPFTAIGWPRLANVTLAVLVALVLYPVLAAWRDERLAFLGVTLLLWTPISLLALHYTNMDTFGGGIWPLIAGALLLGYERLDREVVIRHPLSVFRQRLAKQESANGLRNSVYSGLPVSLPILFLAGFAAGWSVVVRITSLPLFGVLVGYGLFLIWAKQPQPRSRRRQRRNKERRPFRLDRTGWWHLAAFGLGLLVSLGILAAYNYLTFGSILDNGYLYPSPYEEHNLWSDNPLTEVPGGVSTWLAGGTFWDIIVTLFDHVRLWLRPATSAWPLWPLAFFGLIQLLRQRKVERSTWFILLWLLAAYVPYAGVVFFGVTRALAVPYDQGWGYFVPTRYLYTFMLPFVWTLTYLLSRWRSRWAYGLVGLYVAGSAWLFLATLQH